CDQLHVILGKAVFFPQHAAYNLSLSTYWSQQEQSVTPSCILRPHNIEDVSKAIQVLLQYQSAGAFALAACKFAIRGAGHTPWAGSANIDNGVTIDMTHINYVRLNRAATVVSIGAGARWSAVYHLLDAVGLGVAGGRVANVGVGGLITGGGMSYFAPRYGFVCDQVVNFEVVLANGTAVNANSTANSDLWFALKGGSNNFGIVTRFDLKVFQQGKIWGGTIYNPIETLPAQIQAFVGLNNATNYDTNGAMINTYGYSNQIGGWAVANLLVYTKRAVNPPVLRPFTDIQPQLLNTMRLTNMSDITSEQIRNSPSGMRQIVNTTLQTFAHSPGLLYSLVYQPLPSIITSHGAANTTSPNALGLDPTTGPQVLALQAIQWTDPADDALITSAAKEIWQQVDALALTMGMQRRWIYLNYANEDQDPIGSYGAENLKRLRDVSRKYDPTGLFQKNVPGGFKLLGKGAAGAGGGWAGGTY
ncbi:MAG: hypothetical protein Q9186_007685, partial [Xanthomendoza sp. 1 TL-2023]